MAFNKEQSANERLLKIFNFLLVSLIIMVLAVLFVSKFILPQSDRTVHIAIESLNRSFSYRILTLHNLWTVEHSKYLVLPQSALFLNDKEYKELDIDPKQLVFIMSQTGWVRDIKGVKGATNCERIWRVVLGKDLKISYVDVNALDIPKKTLCVFDAEQIGFSYNYNSGDIAWLTE